MECGTFEVRERHQIATFQDFCNDCGNCDTFCPEDGGPYKVKPRFFGSLEAFRRHADSDGFYVERGERSDMMWGRVKGTEYRLEVDRRADRARLHGRSPDACRPGMPLASRSPSRLRRTLSRATVSMAAST